jgi:hypothetical protein
MPNAGLPHLHGDISVMEMSLFTECGVLHLANKIGDWKSIMFTSMTGDVVRRYWHALVRAKPAAGQHDPMERLATFQMKYR